MTRATRLWVLLAREAPRAVIFRRGPSKQVQLLLWHTDTDVFVPGQWFKGRIYERRSDLSPSGQRLIYFAAKFKGPYYSWTAVSHPPYLTALALWPQGDTWGGGGLFVDEDEILLNHSPDHFNLAEAYALPANVVVEPLGFGAGQGEDEPILSRRLTREGWTRVQTGSPVRQPSLDQLGWRYEPPEIWERVHPTGRSWTLRRITHGVAERGGPWYVTEHAVINRDGSDARFQLGRSDWADWDHAGDLLVAKYGRIFRLGFGNTAVPRIGGVPPLIDLRENTFAELAAPAEAMVW